jgi:hypothetical protein
MPGRVVIVIRSDLELPGGVFEESPRPVQIFVAQQAGPVVLEMRPADAPVPEGVDLLFQVGEIFRLLLPAVVVPPLRVDPALDRQLQDVREALAVVEEGLDIPAEREIVQAVSPVGARVDHAVPGDDLEDVRPVRQAPVVGIGRRDPFAFDPEIFLQEGRGLGDLLFHPAVIQAAQENPAAGLFRHGLEGEMLVRVLGDLEHPRGEAPLQFGGVPFDVAADHEDRSGNLQLLVERRDFREEDGRGVLRHLPSDPFLARHPSGNPFHVVSDKQRRWHDNLLW